METFPKMTDHPFYIRNNGDWLISYVSSYNEKDNSFSLGEGHTSILYFVNRKMAENVLSKITFELPEEYRWHIVQSNNSIKQAVERGNLVMGYAPQEYRILIKTKNLKSLTFTLSCLDEHELEDKMFKITEKGFAPFGIESEEIDSVELIKNLTNA